MKYYVVEVHYNTLHLVTSRILITLETSEEREATEYMELHSGYTGPHYNKLLKVGQGCSNTAMTFGKYKGKDIKDVSLNYLMWLWESTDKGESPLVVQEVLRRARLETEFTNRYNNMVKSIQESEDSRLREEKEHYSSRRFELM